MLKLLLSITALLMFSSSIFAAEVVICRKPKPQRILKCILKIEDSEKSAKQRDKVIIFDKSSFVAEGVVGMTYSNHIIGFFPAMSPIKKSFGGKIYQQGHEKKLLTDSLLD